MPGPTREDTAIVIGAGIGGLAAALRLAGAGHPVHVIEASDTPGGKLRTVPSIAGPVDAGPTVLTLRPVFEALFEAAGLFAITVNQPPACEREDKCAERSLVPVTCSRPVKVEKCFLCKIFGVSAILC